MIQTAEQAISIARQDAHDAYSDLSVFSIQAALSNGIWMVDFEPRNPKIRPDGPHYLISAENGEIINKRYA